MALSKLLASEMCKGLSGPRLPMEIPFDPPRHQGFHVVADTELAETVVSPAPCVHDQRGGPMRVGSTLMLGLWHYLEDKHMAGKFEIYKDQSGQWRFRLKARNGEIVKSGESYPTQADAKKGITAVKKAADGAETIDPTVTPKP